MTGSLAFRTDLALRAAEGAEVLALPGATAVRMRGNPAFRWGNFLLVDAAGDPGARVAAHAHAFPEAGFTTIGVDDPHPVLDEGAWLAAGFGIERLAVLETDRAPSVPPSVPGRARRLRTDDDWAAETAIAMELEPDADAGHRAFTERRTVERRQAVAAGSLVWLGMEQEGRIVATAGVGDAGDGVARFQDVQTAVAHRRRGLAGALVAAGTLAAAAAFGSRRFVLVAERQGPAIGVYRRLGFREVETQLQLSRVDETASDGA